MRYLLAVLGITLQNVGWAAVEGFLRTHLKLIVVWSQTVAVAVASTGCFGFFS